MSETHSNAEKFAHLVERMRRLPFNPAFGRFFDLGLSPSHLRAMMTLRSRQLLPMKDLADELGMTPPSVTVLTRRLVTLKLVDREPDATDSRRVLLNLSPTGTALLDEMCAERIASYEQLLAGLSSTEQAQLLTLLGRAVEALEQSTPE